MPTFDFQCKKCGNVFEFTRPFGSEMKPPCPKCNSKRIEKLISTPAVHFKGSGWYKTDSKSSIKAEPKKKEATEGTKEAEKKGTKGTEGTKEIKK
jgi:putative FmdB family regulatory protein